MAAARFTAAVSRLRPSTDRNSRAWTGAAGEREAAVFLRGKGFRILQTNFRCRTGEIDIVAEDDGTLVFVEVKTRSEDGNELPEAAMTRRKKQRLCRAAREFMRVYHQQSRLFRFDVVGIDYDATGACVLHHWGNAIDYRRGLRR